MLRLNAALNGALRHAQVRDRFSRLSAQAIEGSPEDLGRIMREETAKWARVAREAGIKAD